MDHVDARIVGRDDAGMRRALVQGLLALSASAGLAAEEQAAAAAPCDTPGHAQFDFWLGSWSVTNQGKPAGTNLIEKVLDGCAYMETWRSTRGHRGHSLTFYDAARGLWHQTWIDVAGEPLYLEGRFENGTMRLEGTRPAKEGRGTVLHRIEWTAQPDGRVRQHWQSSSDGGRTWSEVFDGYYEKGGAESAAGIAPQHAVDTSEGRS